jgi:transposase
MAAVSTAVDEAVHEQVAALQAVVNGIFYVLKNGCGWRDVPADLPLRSTGYYYFTK